MALHLRSLKFKSTSLPHILSRCFATQVQSSCSGDKRPIADVDWEAFATEVTTICEEVKGRVSSVPQLSAASRLAVLVLESQRLVDAVNKHELANSSDLSANGSPGTCSQMSSSNKAVSWKKIRCRPSRIGQLLSAPRVRSSTGPIKTENVWADSFDSCGHLVQPYSYTTDDIIIRNPYPKENLGFFGGFLLENSENKHLSPEYDQRSRSKLEDNDLLTFTNLPSEQFVHIFGEPIHYCAVPSTSVDLEPPEKPPLPPMKGGPDPDTLNRFREHIVKVLPKFFVAKHDYRAYHPDIVFENNYWGTNIVTNGLNAYAGQLIKYRCLGLLKYAHIEVTVLKATVHPEDGTVRVRWRVKGLSQFKALMFWKFLPWTYKKSVKEESQWFDVYSVFTLNKDGYITKHRIDRVIPDEEVETTKTGNLALKLSLLLGLAPKPGLHDFASLFFRKSSGSAATSNT